MDQDDSMLSTPSSHGNDDAYDDENLFPGATTGQGTHTTYVDAQTPQNDHLNAAAPGELSPPRSNAASITQANGFGAQGGVMAGDADDDLSDGDEAVDMKADRNRGGQGQSEEKNKPGAGWKNKKAQEDMQRAWESIVDKDFDIKQFGDPLAGRHTGR